MAKLYLIVYQFVDEEVDWILVPETEMHQDYAIKLATENYMDNFGLTKEDMKSYQIADCWFNEIAKVRRDENSPQYKVILEEE